MHDAFVVIAGFEKFHKVPLYSHHSKFFFLSMSHNFSLVLLETNEVDLPLCYKQTPFIQYTAIDSRSVSCLYDITYMVVVSTTFSFGCNDILVII